jgi:hypothetical protein
MPESFEEKHISKSNEQFQLQSWYVFLFYNIIRYLQQIFHIYTAAICTPLNSYHTNLLWKKNMKIIFYAQGFEGQIKCKFESILYDFYFQNRSVWWYTFRFCYLYKYTPLPFYKLDFSTKSLSGHLCIWYFDKCYWIVLDGF